MKIWITTDTHFSHSKMIDFGRPKDFEARIKTNMLKNIGQDDVLIHLGDICIGNDIENSNWFKDILGCKTYLVRGNHDKKSFEWYLSNGWDVAVDRLDMKLFGKNIAFSHAPIAWDGYFDINIHGHFHTIDRRRFEPEWQKVLSGYNKLLSLEENNYQPTLLENFIK